jgi:hypothetical protein
MFFDQCPTFADAVMRQEAHRDGKISGCRNVESRSFKVLGEEGVWYLGKYTRAVSTFTIGVERATMLQIAQRFKRQFYDLMAWCSIETRYKTNATCIMFPAGIVQ